MTQTLTSNDTLTFVICGEVFTLAELRDISQYGADTGVNGFTYSSDLYDKYRDYETQIENALEDMGYAMADVFADRKFQTLQQYKEWACWSFLELEAHRICDNWEEVN